jgi:hypothetical protein
LGNLDYTEVTAQAPLKRPTGALRDHIQHLRSAEAGGTRGDSIFGESIYRAKDEIPHTGIYSVFHYQHRPPHNLLMRQGERFPACSRCGERVFFRLSGIAETLISDRDS